MPWYAWLLIAVLAVVPVVARLAEGGPPDNAVVHHSSGRDGEQDGDGDLDVMLAARSRSRHNVASGAPRRNGGSHITRIGAST